jgi:hypothetical protein
MRVKELSVYNVDESSCKTRNDNPRDIYYLQLFVLVYIKWCPAHTVLCFCSVFGIL